MGKLGFFVVHCRQCLTPPRVFRQLKRAETHCGRDHRLTCTQFGESEAAHRFLEEQEVEFKRMARQQSDAVLHRTIKPAVQPALAPSQTQSQQPQPSQPQIKEEVLSPPREEDQQQSSAQWSIGPEERRRREEEVKRLLVEHGAFSKATFESTPVPIVPAQLYCGYFDGASKGNPGASSIGYHLDDPDCRTLISRKGFIGAHRSNNQAEIIAMGLLMADAYCNGVQLLAVRGDSQLSIGLLSGSKTARQPLIQSLVRIPLALRDRFRVLEAQYVPRGYNAKADRLANDALPLRHRR